LNTFSAEGLRGSSARRETSFVVRRRSTLDGHKPVSCIPADPIPIGVSDDRATANFIGHPQAEAERFRNQRMAKSPACESPIHGEPHH
jgi:hypothetical protein